MRWFVLLVALLAPLGASAESGATVERVLKEHILLGFERLASDAGRLSNAAMADCSPGSQKLRTAYGRAFDSWISVGHLRFGPTETGNRAFALAFWPDPRSKTPKALAQLVRTKDPIVDDQPGYSTVSVAARGFYALERMLYDRAFEEADGYACKLIKAIAMDIAVTAQEIHDDWVQRYAVLLTSPGSPGNPYTTPNEPLRELFKALSTGLQFTSEVRLGRPLGTFDRPRPKRAEARFSGRSLRHVVKSLQSLRALSGLLSIQHTEISSALAAAFDVAEEASTRIEDPLFSLVAQPQGRLRVEVLQQRIDRIGEIVRDDLGPALGVGAGFNALDGD